MLLLEDTLTKIKNSINVTYELAYNLDDDNVCDVTDEIERCLYRAGFSYADFRVECGVSKAVIVPKNCSFVVKTPLFGCIYYEELYDELEERYYLDYDNPYFEPYTGSYVDDSDVDIDHSNYCEREEYLYEKAIDAGVEDFFTETKYFGEAKHSRPVYISEKCRPFRWNEIKVSESAKSIVKDERDSRTPGWTKMDSSITALFVDNYGYERTNKMLKFLSDNYITDLHSGNVMISERTGKVVITDYAGFES